MAAYFVTGTDTGVGKTLVTAALLRVASSQGQRAIGIKPVAAGCEVRNGRLVNDDALLLQASASVVLDYPQVNPVALRLAMAPHLAAREEGRRIEVSGLVRHCRSVADAGHDLLLAEGAGGWLVPLNEHETMADLAAALRWPVILVVGMRLGCLNHALLTAQGIRAAGLQLGGWVANSAWAQMTALEQNIASLEQRLTAPRLGTLPFLGAGADVSEVMPFLDLSRLEPVPHARF